MPELLEKNPYIVDTITWLEKAVIGLNLCPFAKAEHIQGRIHYVVSNATDALALLRDFESHAKFLIDQAPEKIETVLLIHPEAMQDFYEYNDFLADAEELLVDLELDGILQVASFHPQYQFAGTDPDDRENYTNRSPYPMLHLLREESVSRAVDSFDDPDGIFERNIATLESLDEADWRAIFK